MKVKIGPYPKKSDRRKIDINIDNYDTWSLDHTLAQIIYPALLQLKATKHGVPHNFSTVGGEDWSDQDSFDFYKEDTNELFDQRVKEWDETLDKMIWAFQQLAFDNYEEQYYHGKAEYDFVKSDKQYPNPITGKLEDTFQMVDKNPDEHWYDSEGHLLHEQRIQEGLELFGKYYRSLWD
jgi:hypothetical protein